MTTSHALLAFLLASSLLTITPGLDTMLVLRTAAVGGPKPARAASLGICLGCLTWGICTSVGLGALLAASRFAYNILRIAGAVYVIYLGYQMFRRNQTALLDPTELNPLPAGNSINTADSMQWFARGLFTNLLNPKVGVFYVTFLPLFIPSGANVTGFSMLLASIHAFEGILWFALLIAAIRPFSTWLAKKHTVKTLDYITGAVFVGFGLKLLLADRR